MHVRIDLVVDTLDDVEVAAMEIARPQSPCFFDARPVAVEAADNVGQCVLMLPHGQPREFHSGRPIAVLRDGRIKPGMDVFRHVAGSIASHRRRIVFWHRVVNIVGQLGHGAIAHELLWNVFRACAAFTVTRLAVFAVDDTPWMHRGALIGGSGLKQHPARCHTQPEAD